MKSTLTRQDIVLVQWECQQFLNKVTMLIDDCEWEQLANCYTKGGTLYRPSDPHTAISGRENILRSFKERESKQTCHILANSVVTPLSMINAKVKSRVWLVSGEHSSSLPVRSASKLLVGTFFDELIFEGNEWLIHCRKGSIELKYDYADNFE